MKPLSGNQVCLILSKHGFINIRQRGSHVIMQKKLFDTTITVPIPMHKELKEGTLRSIIRQSGLAKHDFE